MDNDRNICQNSADNIEVTKSTEFKNDDFYKFWVRGNDDFDYTVAMHKAVCLLSFIKIAENTTESQISGYCIWVDADSCGRYKILDQDHAAEIKLVPAEFVRAKYRQAMYYYNIREEVRDKLQQANKPGAEDLKLQELKSETDSHLIRLVKSLIHDLLDF